MICGKEFKRKIPHKDSLEKYQKSQATNHLFSIEKKEKKRKDYIFCTSLWELMMLMDDVGCSHWSYQHIFLPQTTLLCVK